MTPNARDDDAKLEERTLLALRETTLPRAPQAVHDASRRAFLQGSTGTVAAPPRVKRRWAGFLPAFLPAAAAAALAVVYVAGSRPSERWVVTDAVNRHEVSLARGCGEAGEEVHEGRIAVGPRSELEVQLGDDLRVRMLPGTVVDVPRGPGAWFRRIATLRLVEGEVFGTTAGRPLSYTVRIETPEARATLTGTTFALFRTEEATCICLLEGDLAIETVSGAPVALAVEQRVFIYRDGRPPSAEPLPDMERTKLTMMRNAGMVDPIPVPP